MYLRDIEIKFNQPECNFNDNDRVGDAYIFKDKTSPNGGMQLM